MEKDACGCGGDACGGGKRPAWGRRQFLKAAGMLAGMIGEARLAAWAEGTPGAGKAHGELIPAEKHLSPEWLAALRARGDKEVFAGAALENIAMPCGGIGAGQLYVCGDGTLGGWGIFNDAASNWVDSTFATYAHCGVAKTVAQGFGITVRASDGAPLFKTLDRRDFAEVTFTGEYPVATIRYSDAACPVCVTMEAFSPFIPLNAEDSGLPATVFHITVENIRGEAVEAAVSGWLQNAAGRAYALEYDIRRRTRYEQRDGYALCLHSAEAAAPEAAATKSAEAALRAAPVPPVAVDVRDTKTVVRFDPPLTVCAGDRLELVLRG